VHSKLESLHRDFSLPDLDAIPNPDADDHQKSGHSFGEKFNSKTFKYIFKTYCSDVLQRDVTAFNVSGIIQKPLTA